MTDLCDHKKHESCAHCEEGCNSCGTLEAEQNDSGYCADCAQSRLEYAADCAYESAKWGGSA